MILNNFCLAKTLLRKIPIKVSSKTFTTTSALYAEPPRKKRRIDPSVLRIRVERKIKKHEREISRIESEPRQLIPILEYQLTNSEMRDLKARPGRSMDDLGITESTFKAAQRLWNFYRLEQSLMERRSIKRVEQAQARALETLKHLDEDLYDRTITVDDITLIPYISNHMRKETAANSNYIPPDGYIKETTKVWIM